MLNKSAISHSIIFVEVVGVYSSRILKEDLIKREKIIIKGAASLKSETGT